MAFSPYLIASYDVGLELDRKSWLLPDTAFPVLEDCFVWRKRTRRRDGNYFLGRLVEESTETYANAVTGVDTSWTNSGGPALTHLPVAPGTVTVTIDGLTFTDDGEGNMLDSLSAIVGAIDYLTGVMNVTFAAIGGGPYSAIVTYSFYPNRSVMGLRTWERAAINTEDLIAFDTKKSNLFNDGSQLFEDINFYATTTLPAFDWSGGDNDFFFSTNYQGAFFATNNVPGSHNQVITTIQVDTPAPGQTRVAFAVGTNVIRAGDTVYFTGIVGTVGNLLNDQSFVVTANTTTTITFTATSTGLVYTSGGVAFALQRKIAGDGIRWYANDSQVDGWVNFTPPIRPGEILKGARILVPYKDLFVALSTWEGSDSDNTDFVEYRNRARWSQNGTVYYSAPVPENQTADPESWRDDIPGRGGFVDAPTSEAIIGASFVRDTLLVFFERSTWALRYTGNAALPFIWVRVDADFGCESQFSTVSFDRGVLFVGDKGICTADGNNVSRIDLIIPSVVFDFLNDSESPSRVHGIRDYYNELVYWTYVDGNTEAIYPNRMLVYNYRENSYAIFKDSYTCFGYFQNTQPLLWNTANINWEDADFLWNSAQSNALFPDIVAGTNGGYVMILNRQSSNGEQIAISSISQAAQAVVTTAAPHNLESGSFVKIVNVEGMTEINNLNTEINVLSTTTFECIDIDSTAFSAYTTGGDVIRINNFRIVTKKFNPFIGQAKGVAMNRIDFFTNYTENGRISVYVYVDDNTDTPVNVPPPGDTQLWQTILPLDQLPGQLSMEKVWTRFWCHVRGQFVQIELTLSKDQMLDDEINSEDFELHAMIPNFAPSGRLI